MTEPYILIPGDSPTLRFAITTPPPDSTTDGDPFDLTDYNIDFYIKRSMQDDNYTAEFHGQLNDGVVISFTPEDGQVDVRIPHEVTSGMRLCKPYPYYLQLSHSIVTEQIYVVTRGTFITKLPEGD